jgi:signal transduction histidine kinase
MTNLLEDVLTVGKSEAGKIKVKRVSLNLKEFCETLVEEARSAAKEKRAIEFLFTSNQSMVTIDDRLFRNIFINLLTNAIKFSAIDSTVHVSVEDFKEGVMLTVADQGIGIGQEDLESVFEAFHRGANASQVQGTGLGLSITKKAVDLMKGYIHVESELNKGTTFKVQIPTNEENPTR